MTAEPDESKPFPLRAVLGLVVGFLAATLWWNLLPGGPADVLPSLPAEPKTPAIEWSAEKGDDEFRVVAVGLSPTMGYPYLPVGVASFATLCDVGLRAAGAAAPKRIRVAPLAMDSADAPTVVELCRLALQHDPDLLLVELGANEASTRLFGERPLIGPGWLGALADRTTRARLPLDALGRELVGASEADGAGVDEPGESPQQRAIRRIFEARPGQPLVDGLPVTPLELEALADRAARAIDQIAELAAAAGVEVVVWTSPFDLHHAWPIGMVGVEPALDELVARLRAGEEVGLEEGFAAVENPGDRADAWRVVAELRRRHGVADRDDLPFRRARDLDPAPMHVVGPVIDAVAERAAALEGVHFEALADGLDAGFIDVTHPGLAGQRDLALRLRDLLARRDGLAASVPSRDSFLVAVDAFVAARIPTREARIAEGKGARIDVLTHMIFGAVRDALPRFAPALDGLRLEVAGPQDPDWQHWAVVAAVAAAGVAGDLESLGAGTDEERTRRIAEWSLELWNLEGSALTARLLDRAQRSR